MYIQINSLRDIYGKFWFALNSNQQDIVHEWIFRGVKTWILRNKPSFLLELFSKTGSPMGERHAKYAPNPELVADYHQVNCSQEIIPTHYRNKSLKAQYCQIKWHYFTVIQANIR